ncbi:MAG: N-acetyl-gamma-glutamyl-phosphate reductase [Pseudomonadales bacterium]
MTRVFIDGEAGTTGLQIAERLAARSDLTLLRIDASARKDTEARRELFAAADIAILCLPDDAAREAVTLADGHCRLIDASTAHRTHPDWIYGLPELEDAQRARIARANRVANPGCYPQGFILLVRPLIEAGLLNPAHPLSLHALSGYSGGGRVMIETYEGFDTTTRERNNTRPYGLTLKHKHVPEMQHFSGTRATPLFVPSVGCFAQGMLVHVPLFSADLSGGPSARDIRELLAARYADEPFVRVLPVGADTALEGGFLNATACNDTNRVELMVFGHDSQILLTARYDNLGKGAAGAAIQNLNLMLGREETLGLIA